MFQTLLDLDASYGLDVNVIGDNTLPVVWSIITDCKPEAILSCLERTSDFALRSVQFRPIRPEVGLLTLINYYVYVVNECNLINAYLERAREDCSGIVLQCDEIDTIMNVIYPPNHVLFPIQGSIKFLRQRQKDYKQNIVQELGNALRGHSLADIFPLLRCILEWSWCCYEGVVMRR